MTGFPIKKPTPFELWILKWIVFPLVLLFLFVTLLRATERRWECSRICKDKGFYSYSYQHRSDSCVCITEEESKAGNLVPNGTRVF